jgi:hypothetical protein
MSSLLIMTISASFPGASVPILFASPAQFAPWMVADSSTSRTLTGSGRFISPAKRRFWRIARCIMKAARISANMSVEYDVSLSTEKPGLIP